MTTETKRTILLFVGSSFVSVATVVISFGLYANRDNGKVITQKLEQKVDKTVYEADQKVVNDRLDNCEVEVKQLLIEIKEGQAEMKTDIKWLKEKQR